jgi:ABC-type xylose transport system permease subunit
MSGIAGVVYTTRFGGATPTFGVSMELNAIAAAVIDGASLKGGSGTIYGAVLGLALLSVVTSSLILLDVSVYFQDVMKGAILLIAVSLDPLNCKSSGFLASSSVTVPNSEATTSTPAACVKPLAAVTFFNSSIISI